MATIGWSQKRSTVVALEAYDPATRRWSGGAGIPVPLAGASVAVADGKMYVIGGCDAHNCGHKSVQIYDPAKNAWRTGAPYPTPISWESCGTVKTDIYCAGGVTGNSGFTSAAFAYNLATSTWSRIAPLPLQQWGAGYTATNGRLLVSGGVIVSGGGGETLTNLGFAYDPASNTWTRLPDSSNTTYRGGSACGFTRIGGLASQYLVLARQGEQLPEYSGCEFGKVP
jgi:N-acetylneuraminic acid mutarotase